MNYQTFIFWGILLLMFFSTRFIAKKWQWGFLIAGWGFGVYNEISYAFAFHYSDILQPFVWKRVPLIVILAWGVMGCLCLVISSKLHHKLNIKGFYIHFLDVLCFSIMGITQEQLNLKGSTWHYNFPILDTWQIQVLGYIGVGFIISFAGRSIQSCFDKKQYVE